MEFSAVVNSTRSSDISARFFLYPASSTEQLTVVELGWDSRALHALTLRFPGPIISFEAGVPAGLLDSLVGCFPSTAPRKNAWDDDSGDECGAIGGDIVRIPTGARASDTPLPAGARAEVRIRSATQVGGDPRRAAENKGDEWIFCTAQAPAQVSSQSPPEAVVHRLTAFFCVRHRLSVAGLWLPLSSTSAAPSRNLRWVAFSAGGVSLEEGGWNSAGSTPCEALGALRRRLATGSFRDIHAPTLLWPDVAQRYALNASLTLRVRKGEGPPPTADVYFPVESAG